MIQERPCGAEESAGGSARSRPGFALALRLLDAWGVSPPAGAGRRDLDVLHAACLKQVPFENVTKLLRAARAGRADAARRRPVEFWEDHLRWGTGGTCFSATSAFRWLLRRFGFRVRTLFCHLPAHAPRAHTALLVETTSGPCLTDVGYALPAPVPLPRRDAIRRRTPWYDVEIRRGPGGELLVFSADDRGTRFRYRFKPVGVGAAAFREAWLETLRPDARLMRRLALGKLRDGTRTLYAEPGHLVVLSRSDQRRVEIGEPRARRLAECFGLPEDLIAEALDLLRGEARAAGGRSSPRWPSGPPHDRSRRP